MKSAIFDRWLSDLRDVQGRARILVRIDRLAAGNAGDAKSVGQGVSEMRIDFGPGYRIYYTAKGKTLILLLIGGDKSSQPRDIARAMELAKQWREP